MAIDEQIKKADRFVTKKGKKAKEMIKEIAKDAEPIVKQIREKIQKGSAKAEKKAKEFYNKKIRKK